VKKRRRAYAGKVRSLDIPVPDAPPTPERLLSSKLGSKAAADRAMAAVAYELRVPQEAPRSTLAAIALAKLGADLDAVAKSLEWEDFEAFCAMVLTASGYEVRRNVRLRKPTRQIDIVAESPSLVLVVDCKHWRKGLGLSSLGPIISAQAERAGLLLKAHPKTKPHLPVIITVLDNQARVVDGVPVVPLQGLKDFLSSVNRFDQELSFIGS
jgi:hypothetical protein